MSDKAETAQSLDCADQRLRVVGESCHLLAGIEDKQMIFLGVAVLIVDFLAGEDERTFLTIPMISVHSLHPGVVVGDQEHVHASFKGRTPQVRVRTGAIRVGSVHVQVNDQFVH